MVGGEGITTLVEVPGTPPHQLEGSFHEVLVAPSQVPMAVIVIAWVLPEVAVVEQLLSDRELMVTVVAPAVERVGVLNVPPFEPPLTVMDSFVAP